MIPVFIIFKEIRWVGTFYPLWVPAWFGAAFYIFLMRQYMLTLPLELDEAAKIDGASNFRILWQVIAPLCGPAVATITIFAFLQHYNAFMEPLIYISESDMYTLPLGLLWFKGRFGNFWHLVMAASDDHHPAGHPHLLLRPAPVRPGRAVHRAGGPVRAVRLSEL